MDDKLKNIWLVSFGDSRLQKPRKRLLKQAKEFGFADDHVFIMDENDLDAGFKERMKDKLVLGSRGFGYWCWKPEVMLETFRKMPEGDILLYIDIGCHLNKKGKERFYDYLEIVKTKGALAAQSRSLLSSDLDNDIPDSRHHVYRVSDWTKGDLLDFYEVRNVARIVNAGQITAGIIFMKKSAQSIGLLKEWADLFATHFELLDDTPSQSPNMTGYIANRHDQAALTILWLLKRLPTISGCEVEPLRKYGPACPQFRRNPTWGRDWFWQMRWYPILAKRDKGLVPYHLKIWRFLRDRALNRLFK